MWFLLIFWDFSRKSDAEYLARITNFRLLGTTTTSRSDAFSASLSLSIKLSVAKIGQS